jgi:hypothetical protein
MGLGVGAGQGAEAVLGQGVSGSAAFDLHRPLVRQGQGLGGQKAGDGTQQLGGYAPLLARGAGPQRRGQGQGGGGVGAGRLAQGGHDGAQHGRRGLEGVFDLAGGHARAGTMGAVSVVA